MGDLVYDRRFQLVAFAVAMAVIGAIIGLFVSSSGAESGLGDRVEVSTGAGAKINESLPLTATLAKTAGWKDLVECFNGKGRYFERTDGQGQPGAYLLAYNVDDELIGVHLVSRFAMTTPPWEYMPDGLIGVTSYEFEHWALPVFFKDPKLACTASE